MNKNIIKIIYFSLIFVLFVPLMFNLNFNVHAESKAVNLIASLFENEEHYSTSNSVNTMTNGHSELCKIKMNGDILTESTKRNKKAYGLNGNVSFSFIYDGTLLDSSDVDNWHIRSDDSTSVDGYSFSGSINKGVLLILKSKDGSEYELATNPITNFFADNPNGVSNFYTTRGEDIFSGMYYKIIIAYMSGYRYKDGWFSDKYKNIYCMQQYEFYLCDDTRNVSLHNLSVTEDDLFTEEFDIEYLKKGETLEDGSVTTAGFEIDKLGIDNTIYVSKNNGEDLLASNGEEFTETGKYKLRVISKLGNVTEKTIYVFSYDDKGYSTYFGDNLIKANRVFRYGDYPTYAKGAYIQINEVDEFTPVLYGTITNIDTGETVFTADGTRNQQTFSLDPANYEINFYSGDPNNTGSMYNYKFKFEVINEKSSPYVNYDNLMKTERLEDLQSKHYEVAYQMTKGGHIYVCFSLDSYDEAFKYAYEIEKRFIKITDDGIYYKSIDNPNKPEKYYDYIKLTEVLNYYAKQNVEVNYFNSLDEFTYQTYDNDLLTSLESLNIKESIKVFPSQEEKEKLINRKLYINNFEFINVADYDVVSVVAYCEKDGKYYNIDFNNPIQLPFSSKYTITETNIYGDEKSYDVYYINENVTISHWFASLNGVESIVDISARDVKNGKIEMTADSLILNDIINELDDNAIVTIKAPSLYAYEIKCLVSEMKGFTLYEKGDYELTFIDRLGKSYKFIVHINGAKWEDILAENTTSYTSLYNKVYLNAKVNNSNELSYDCSSFTKIMEEISSIVYMLYTKESIQNLVDKYNYALEVSKNNPRQKEIDQLTAQLNELKDKLILRENKKELYEVLTDFANKEYDNIPADKAIEYKNIYDSAYEVLYDLDSSDAEINNAINSILEMKGEIENPSNNNSYIFIIVLASIIFVSCLGLYIYFRKRGSHEKNN